MRLKPKDIKSWKAKHWTGYCDLCKEPLSLEDSVGDHNHQTGQMRGILHRRCNSLEGVITRALKRFGFQRHPKFLDELVAYSNSRRFAELHPTYRTSEEKKEKAKRRRKALNRQSTGEPNGKINKRRPT
jgi:hypothetical protein